MLSEEHKKKISESIKRRWKEGKQKTVTKCSICGAFLGKNHNCENNWKKMSETKKKNPTRYWLGKHRSRKTIDAMQRGRELYDVPKGSNSPFWKGGNPSLWRNNARKIMAKKLGRELKTTEIVHHIDGDYTNNAIKNLVITNRKEHINIHRQDLIDGLNK